MAEDTNAAVTAAEIDGLVMEPTTSIVKESLAGKKEHEECNVARLVENEDHEKRPVAWELDETQDVVASEKNSDEDFNDLANIGDLFEQPPCVSSLQKIALSQGIHHSLQDPLVLHSSQGPLVSWGPCRIAPQEIIVGLSQDRHSAHGPRLGQNQEPRNSQGMRCSQDQQLFQEQHGAMEHPHLSELPRLSQTMNLESSLRVICAKAPARVSAAVDEFEELADVECSTIVQSVSSPCWLSGGEAEAGCNVETFGFNGGTQQGRKVQHGCAGERV